jgi:hypothetical protein
MRRLADDPLIRCAALAALTLIVWLPSSPRAGPVTPRERVELALSGIEAADLPTKAQLLRLSPVVDEVLRDIVERPSRRALARSRAMWALRDFASPATAATLHKVILKNAKSADGLARLDLQQALTSYAAVVGPKSLGVTAPFLSHASIDVRHAAAFAVALSRGPAARALLVARRKVEPSATVRHQLDRQIAALAKK